MRTLLRYWAMQIPGIAIIAILLALMARFDLVSSQVAILLLVLWLAKDAAMYPLVRASYEPAAATGAARLIGELAIARRDIAPEGYVNVRGSLWQAICHDRAIPAGTTTRVTGSKGMRLIVEPCDDPKVENRPS